MPEHVAPSPNEDLAQLFGVGPVLVKRLACAGITSVSQLRAAGSKQAFLCIRTYADPTACLHTLYALEAAVQGVPKPLLAPETKAELRTFFSGLPTKTGACP